MSSRNWPSESLLQLDVFKAAGANSGDRDSALALCTTAYQRAEHIWKKWGACKCLELLGCLADFLG